MPRTEFEHLQELALSRALEELEAEKAGWKEEKGMMIEILSQLNRRVKELTRDISVLSAKFEEKVANDEAIAALLAGLNADASR
ncbi:MAG: hypothetical protein ABIJ09_18185 [Pseudomonadota bacterium]